VGSGGALVQIIGAALLLLVGVVAHKVEALPLVAPALLLLGVVVSGVVVESFPASRGCKPANLRKAALLICPQYSYNIRQSAA
jgi:hypothetical protein